MSYLEQAVQTVERLVGNRRSWPPAPPAEPGQRSGYELAAALAHDLRSPVSAIHMLADAMQSGAAGRVTEAQQRQLGLIRSAAFTLCAFATDVEEMARGGHDPLDGGPTPFSIGDVFADVYNVVAPLREAKGIALRFHVLPTDPRLGHVHALSRILLNLTMNALQASDRGTVDVTADPLDQRRVEFSVCDDGPGFDTGSLALGLGLTICRDLVEALGSTLDMTSQPGVGSRVRFILDLPPAPV
jgi:signal transduction histidine kinase